MKSTNQAFMEAAGILPMFIQSMGGLGVAEYYRNKTKREMMELMRDKVVPGAVASAGAVAGLSSFAGGLGALGVWANRKRIARAAGEVQRGATRGLRKARNFVRKKARAWGITEADQRREYGSGSKWLSKIADNSVFDWIDQKSPTLGSAYHALIGGDEKRKHTGLMGLILNDKGNPVTHAASPGGLINFGKHMVTKHPLVSALGAAYAIGNTRNVGRMLKTGARNLKSHLKRTYREFKARTTAPVKKAAEVVGYA